MKKVFFALLLIFGRKCVGQTVIGCYPITVTVNKTSNLIFPYAVKSVDRGSRDLLAQKAGGTENVLQLKAAREDFPPTTLSVITADGLLYPFVVSYEPMPAVLNLSFSESEGRATVRFSGGNTDASVLKRDAALFLGKSAFLRDHVRSLGVELALKGIYLKDSLLWFSLAITDVSMIPFVPAALRFSIVDRSRTSRTALQEQEILPVYVSNLGVVNGKHTELFVCAFRMFILPRDKKLKIAINEPSGGRLLTLLVRSRQLLKTKE